MIANLHHPIHYKLQYNIIPVLIDLYKKPNYISRPKPIYISRPNPIYISRPTPTYISHQIQLCLNLIYISRPNLIYISITWKSFSQC